MYILGLSCFYHDSAACLLRDGEIVAAVQEERFTRKKHDPGFPSQAIAYCLSAADITVDHLDYLVYYDKPFPTFERLLMSYLTVAPRGVRSWMHAMPAWLGKKLHMPKVIKKEMGYAGDILFTEHHEAHAASAYYPSPFDEAAILTVDGVGEWATASYGYGRGRELHLLKEMNFPDSLGLLYSAFTYFTGFKVNSGEYKLMGLAPYGRPKYKDRILSELIDLKPDGSLRLDMSYFDFLGGLRMTNRRFAELFEGPPRAPETEITQREMDIAASIQSVTEEALLRMAAHVHRETRCRYLCMAGGVALNCVSMGRILRETDFEDVWIQPAAGDAGCALGAAYSVWHRFLEMEREIAPGESCQGGSYWGPRFSNDRIEAFLDSSGYPYHRLGHRERAGIIADLIASGRIVGYMAGAMEFGPRALGARSILGDPRNPDTQAAMNLKIKYRESFRPFAPAVLEEKMADYFDMDRPSPYMLFIATVKQDRRIDTARPGNDLPIMERINQVRSDIPAVTHLDYTARLQSVNKQWKPDFHEVISEFERLTQCPVVVNTSFNVRGEPIVCSPRDAYRCFMRTHMDVLVMEDVILYKDEQPIWADTTDWRQEYELD